MKKIISILMSLMICLSLPSTVSAHAIPTNFIQPYYELAMDAKSYLDIRGTIATCISQTDGMSGVVKIVINQYFQKQGFLWIWSTYDGAEWSETTYSDSHAIVNTKSGLTSGKYRLKSVFTLTDKNGETEIFTVYSDEMTVS